MKTSLFLAFLSFYSSQLWSSPLCERVNDGLASYLEQASSRISFKNRGGLFNGGVCWWHSRLQRSSAYLADFRPNQKKPSSIEARKIFHALKSMKQTVVIPGFADFYNFTSEYKDEAQALLEAWQREDGFINQEWIRGISGQSKLSSEAMKQRMDTLYSQFKVSPRPIWVMAQIKGVTAHAFLVLDMIALGSGYELHLIDSNAPGKTKTYEYALGDSSLKFPTDNYSFVPYLGFQKDMVAIKAAVEKKCGNILGIDDYIPMGEIELK